MLNTINREKTRILAGFEEIRDTAFETGELEAEERQLNGEMNVAAELIQKCIGERRMCGSPSKTGWRFRQKPNRKYRLHFTGMWGVFLF